jgi:hypothetical protein
LLTRVTHVDLVNVHARILGRPMSFAYAR